MADPNDPVLIRSEGSVVLSGEQIRKRLGRRAGTVDAGPVADALQRSDIERPRERLHHALGDSASFAMFSAAPTLPPNAELSPARRVDQQLKTIHI